MVFTFVALGVRETLHHIFSGQAVLFRCRVVKWVTALLCMMQRALWVVEDLGHLLCAMCLGALLYPLFSGLIWLAPWGAFTSDGLIDIDPCHIMSYISG